MSVYVIAQLKLLDRARYQQYVARFMEVLIQFGGRLLAADEHPEVLEGTWDRDKVVLLSFRDEGAFRTWANSEAYQAISVDRVASTEGPVILVHSLS